MSKIRYHLILEAKADTVEAATRLKRLLKFALRVCRLRCVEVREVKPEEKTA